MAALKNARHERFAQELAKGKTQSQAYLDAGYEGDVTAASRLSRNVKVQARVAELKAGAARRAEISVASITERLMGIADKGEEKGGAPMLAVARAALMDAAKLNGLVIDKADNTETATMTVTYVTSAAGPAPPPSAEDYETEA